MIFFFPFLLYVSACALVGIAALGRGRHTGRSSSRSAVETKCALALSLASIAAFTLFPTGDNREVHLIPFGDITAAFRPPLDVFLLAQTAANALLFAPLGASLRLTGLSMRTACVLGLGLSVFVELMQWFVVNGRTTSIDDVLMNTLGTAVGYAVASYRLKGRVEGTDGVG